MDMHLSDTLELRWLLRQRAANRKTAALVLNEFDKFLIRLALGRFRLRDEADLDPDHRKKLCAALAAVSGESSSKIKLIMHPLTGLLRPKQKAQQRLYEIARNGSVGTRLRTCGLHLSVLEQAQAWYVPRALIEDALASQGLTEVLRLSQYGTSFSKIFVDDIVTFFTCVFAHACAGNTVVVKRLLPLSKIFRSNMPIGLLPKAPGDETLRWHVFTA